MSFKQASCIEKNYVGRVESDTKWGKIKLFNKNNQLIISLWVEAKNIYDYINVYQEEETKAFVQFIEQHLICYCLDRCWKRSMVL